jgi:hypothetical protein
MGPRPGGRCERAPDWHLTLRPGRPAAAPRPRQVPSDHYNGEAPLALPKLNLQFLTAHGEGHPPERRRLGPGGSAAAAAGGGDRKPLP